MVLSEEETQKLIDINRDLKKDILDLTIKSRNNSKYGGVDKGALKSSQIECRDYKSKLTKLNEFCRKIQDGLLLYKKKFQKRKDTVESLQGEKSKNLKQIERLTTKNKERESKIDNLESKIDNLESKLDKATTRISYLEKELNKKYKESSIVLVEGTSEDISEQYVNRIKKLEDELSQQNDELSQLNNELSSMRSINTGLELELHEYKQGKDTMFKDLQRSEAKLIDLINKRDSLLPNIVKMSDEKSAITDFITLPIEGSEPVEGSGPDDEIVQSDRIVSQPQLQDLIDQGVPGSNTLLFIVGAIFLIIIVIYLIFSNKKPKSTYQPQTDMVIPTAPNNIPLNISNRVATKLKGGFRIHR
jgi:phage shock protein A